MQGLLLYQTFCDNNHFVTRDLNRAILMTTYVVTKSFFTNVICDKHHNFSDKFFYH